MQSSHLTDEWAVQDGSAPVMPHEAPAYGQAVGMNGAGSGEDQEVRVRCPGVSKPQHRWPARP